MAKSGNTSNSSNAASSGAENGKKAASSAPVVLSVPVDPTEPVISHIPPSVPIESTMLGKSAAPIPAASKIDTSAPAAPPLRLTPDTDMASDKSAATPATKAAEKAVTTKAEPVKQAPATAKPAPAQTVEVRKGGFWPMALGGVVAAGLGAAAAIWATPYLGPLGLQPGPAAEAVDPAAIRNDAVAAATEAATAAGSTAGTAAAEKAIAALPPAEAADAGLQAELTAQAEKIAALEAALAERPASAPAPAAADGQTPAAASTAAVPANLASEISSLREASAAQARQIEELLARPQLDAQALSQVQALAQSTDQVKAEIESAAASARESLDAVQAEAEAATRRAQTVASVAALGAALEHGESAGEAVQQLEQAGVAVPEPLAQEDLPTLVQIQMGFDAVARAALKDSLKAESRDGGAMTAMGNFLRVQTGARSVEPREGTDPDAVLSRAGALVQQGEIAPALDELAALPPEGQQAMADWMTQAKAYLAAEAALNDVATTLN